MNKLQDILRLAIDQHVFVNVYHDHCRVIHNTNIDLRITVNEPGYKIKDMNTGLAYYVPDAMSLVLEVIKLMKK